MSIVVVSVIGVSLTIAGDHPLGYVRNMRTRSGGVNNKKPASASRLLAGSSEGRRPTLNSVNGAILGRSV
jgi:hypothetical protein